MALIQIENVSVSYGSPPKPVLRGIDTEIHEGEFVCVLGATGCGKSTLLRMILGSERPTSGRILIDGVEHTQPGPSRGYVPQKYSLFPDRTVLDNITFGPEVSEFSLLGTLLPGYYKRRREFRDQAYHYIHRVGLRDSDAKKYPDELSGGMQQRVAIAQALMNEPRILLMDEAFSALDPKTRKDMQELIRELWQSLGTTILFVTHNTREAACLASRILMLAKTGPDQGSSIGMDFAVDGEPSDAERASLAERLEFHPTEVADSDLTRTGEVVSIG